MTDELTTLLAGRVVGVTRADKRGRFSFHYAPDWRDNRSAYPLSHSMPLAAAEHGHAPVESFLWGLLPDNEFILSEWARRYHVSPRNPFALISHVGEDCAGAVQFVGRERVEANLGTQPETVEWIDTKAIAERLRLLRTDQAAWRTMKDTGQFSLAGAQPKTALLFDGSRWGVPPGRTPTTHILKPPTQGLAGHAENEHFCLVLAQRLGLPTANSEIMQFEDQAAIVVTRYDRERAVQGLIRIHQEDMCQALGVLPMNKYENQGGPGAKAIVELLHTYSDAADEDVGTFVDALVFNWLIAGPDAHAKNYSLLLGAGGRTRLAPLYDLASALPYDSMDIQKVTLAMRVGKDDRLRDIAGRAWRKLAQDIRFDEDALMEKLKRFTDQVPDQASEVKKGMQGAGLNRAIVDRLADRIAARAVECRKGL